MQESSIRLLFYRLLTKRMGFVVTYKYRRSNYNRHYLPWLLAAILQQNLHTRILPRFHCDLHVSSLTASRMHPLSPWGASAVCILTGDVTFGHLDVLLIYGALFNVLFSPWPFFYFDISKSKSARYRIGAQVKEDSKFRLLFGTRRRRRHY